MMLAVHVVSLCIGIFALCTAAFPPHRPWLDLVLVVMGLANLLMAVQW